MRETQDDRLLRLRRSVTRAGRRLRYRVALSRLATWLPLPLGTTGAALAALKVFRLGETAQSVLLAVCAGTGLLALGKVLQGLFAKPPRWAGSLALDEYHRLDDRVTTALELLETEGPTPKDLAALAIEDGIQAADALDVRRAVPLPIPRELAVSALLAGLLFGIAWLEVRVVRVIPPSLPFEALVLTEEDLSLFGEIGEELAEHAEDPGSQTAIRRFNSLIEDIAARRLDRKQAFERLGTLEAELSTLTDADRDARELGLEGLARELSRSGLTKSAAEALEQRRLADAERALRELAERLRQKDKVPTKAELERLRSAFARAARVNTDRLDAIEERRRELADERKSLLSKHAKKADPKSAENEPSVQENKRKLERLSRDKGRAERASKEFSELDRQLAEAAEQLTKDLGKSAEGVENSAEDLNRVARRALSEKEKRELLERMRELREVLRQGGQSGPERERQMKRFDQRARGKGKGPKGESDQGKSRPGAGAAGKGAPGASGGQATLLEIPRFTRGPSASSKPGQPGKDGGNESGSSGREPGKGHNPNVTAESASKPIGETQDVTAAGIDSGQGTASAEVISGAAERGFVGRGYRDVFVQYQNVAEQALEQDRIPPGYRFYVKRYFQLIRPRE